MWAKFFFGSFASSAIVMLTGLVTGVLTARLLGPEGRGVLAIVVSWSGLFVIAAQLPLSEAILLRQSEKITARTAVGAAFSVGRRLLLFSYPVSFVVIYYIFSAYDVVPVYYALAFFLVSFISAIFTNIYKGVLQLHNEFYFLQTLMVLQPILYALFMLPIYFLGADVELFLAANALSILVFFLVRILMIRGRGNTEILANDRDVLLKGIVPLHAQNFIRLVGAQIDKLAIVALATAKEAGLYFVALTFAGILIGVFVTAIRMMGLPFLVARQGGAKLDKTKQLLSYTVIFSLFAGALSALAAPFAIPLLFGASFQGAIVYAMLLSLIVSFTAIRDALTEVLKSIDRSNELVVANVTFVVCFIILVSGFYAFSDFGVYGVCLALAIVNVGVVVTLSMILSKALPGLRVFDWAVPKFSTLREMYTIGRRALVR